MKRLAIITVFALIAITAAARPITFEDLAAFKRIGGPVLSPDGKWIAYDVTTVDLPKNASSRAVWLMRSDGSDARQIADGDGAAWSPDGKTIAYTSGGQISLFYVATGKSRKLPELRGGASSLQWMPDGSAVLAVSDIHPDCGVEPKCTCSMNSRSAWVTMSRTAGSARTSARIAQGSSSGARSLGCRCRPSVARTCARARPRRRRRPRPRP